MSWLYASSSYLVSGVFGVFFWSATTIFGNLSGRAMHYAFVRERVLDNRPHHIQFECCAFHPTTLANLES